MEIKAFTKLTATYLATGFIDLLHVHAHLEQQLKLESPSDYDNL